MYKREPTYPRRQCFPQIKIGVSLLLAILLASATALVYAANPIITNRFIADPSAHVFNNRVYIYMTDDQTNSGADWDSKDWRAYSSTDLVNWTDHGQIFAIGGGFSWASIKAWAPAAAQRNGFYYLYLPVDQTKIGVARSTSPSSGFVDARGTPLIDKARDANAGDEPIDPMVFIDDDGQAYMYFGTRAPKVVKLNTDMISTSGSILNLSVSGNNYAEAPWLIKRNGVYYFSYSTGWPGQIAYATGTSPLGPFTYKGVALDYVNINTNHEAIINYNSQWFMVYHKNALPGGGNFKRSVVIDCMYFNADGSIPTVIQTTTGVTSTSCGTAPVNYRLNNRNSSKVIDVQQPNTSNGAKVGQYTWNGNNWQKWRFVDKGGGYYNIVSVHSGKCLDVNGASTADGASIIQWTCGSGNNQQWQWVAVGSYFQLKARHSGKCLNVVGSSTANGALLEQRTCSSTNNAMQWSRTQV